MTKNFATHAVAFSLATVVTATLLASVSGVADRQYEGAAVAQTARVTAAIPTQHVVIIGKRIA